MKKSVAQLWILLLLALLVGAGCSKGPTTEGAPTKRGLDLLGELSSLSERPSMPLDANYVLPSKEWLQWYALTTSREIERIRNSEGFRGDDAFDCDDSANYGRTRAVLLNLPHGPPGAGIAVGIAWVTPKEFTLLGLKVPLKGGGGERGTHCLNIAACSDGFWYLIEVQTGYMERLTKLLKEEKIQVNETIL